MLSAGFGLALQPRVLGARGLSLRQCTRNTIRGCINNATHGVNRARRASTHGLRYGNQALPSAAENDRDLVELESALGDVVLRVDGPAPLAAIECDFHGHDAEVKRQRFSASMPAELYFSRLQRENAIANNRAV